MQDNFRPALKIDEIASGGMKTIEVEGHEIVICNCDGQFYALARRCGHMNAPLELGTLDGTILTCAMLMRSVRTESIRTYQTKVEMDQIWVAIP